MFAGMTKAKKLLAARTLCTEATDRDRRWQNTAKEDFAFRDGYQWTSAEKQILEEEMRPILTMNLTKSSCDLIMGMNEDNKMQFRAAPAEPTDGFLAEVLNDILAWVNERFDFDEEEDGALESAVICGRGYVGIDFLPDPDKFGEIVLQEINIPVHEIHFDPSSRRHKLEDASYIVWDRWLTRHDFQMRWPSLSNKAVDDLVKVSGSQSIFPENAAADTPGNAFDTPHDIEHQDDKDYDYELDFEWYDRSRNMVRIAHMEYWEMYKRYFVFNPEQGEFLEWESGKPTAEQKEEFLMQFEQEMVIEEISDKRVKWLTFAGDRILFDGESPLPYKGFSVVPVFAYRDMSQRTPNHFGIVRLMKDPQKEVNKRWSQTLNLLNQQVQTGIYAETDAFVDQRQAEASMKEPGAITWVNSGALTGGKIKERNVPQFPNAPMQMEQFSQEIMKKITGINPDLLGQDRGRQEPGVVVRLRQQQGITLLKPLFSNFNKCKRELFKRQMSIIMEFMPDAQILRILGETDRYTINEEGVIIDNENEGLMAELRDVRNLEYNIISEQSSGNISKRMSELQVLLEMQQNMPVPPEQIIEKLDVAASEKAKWLKYIEETTAAQNEQQSQMMQTQIQMEQKKIEQTDEKNLMEFMIDLSKIHQMGEKDEKSMKKDFARMEKEEQNNMFQGAISLLQMMKESKEEGGSKDGTVNKESSTS